MNLSFNYRCLSLGISIFIFLFMVGCEDTGIDPCDSTVESEKAVTIKVTAHVITTDNEPIVGQNVNITIYKNPCGADPKGHFEYSGQTDQTGTFYAGVVGYNLRNSKDQVIASAVAPGLVFNIGSNFSEEVYTYSEFTEYTKEVHLYIYGIIEE